MAKPTLTERFGQGWASTAGFLAAILYVVAYFIFVPTDFFSHGWDSVLVFGGLLVILFGVILVCEKITDRQEQKRLEEVLRRKEHEHD